VNVCNARIPAFFSSLLSIAYGGCGGRGREEEEGRKGAVEWMDGWTDGIDEVY